MKNFKEQAVKRYKENKRNFSGLIQTSVRETQIYSRKDKYYASTITTKAPRIAFLSIRILCLQHVALMEKTKFVF